MKRLACLAAALFFSLAADALAQGADYLGRVVKVIVPFPAGGATDIMARNISQKLSETWKQPVIVENRGGANGTIGADVVAKSAADGYTVLAATIIHSAGVSLLPNTPYRFQKDLQPVAIMGLLPIAVVVRTDSPIKSLQGLVASSKAKELNGGSGGNGTAAHLTLELFKGATGAKIQHIPYKGGAPAMTDLLGGQIDVIFALLPEALPHVKAGKLRALAVLSGERHPLLPDVPTSAEAGFANMEVTSWNGLMVPANTPREVVAKINADVVRLSATPELRARIIESGFQPAAFGVADTEAYVRADIERWSKVVREANIKAD